LFGGVPQRVDSNEERQRRSSFQKAAGGRLLKLESHPSPPNNKKASMSSCFLPAEKAEIAF